jgi:hypothetical protein
MVMTTKTTPGTAAMGMGTTTGLRESASGLIHVDDYRAGATTPPLEVDVLGFFFLGLRR